MPVLFVHGVNNRKESPGYEPTRLVTDAFIKKHLEGVTVAGKKLTAGFVPFFPYWGDLGVKFAWKMASLPSGEINTLGGPGTPPDLRPIVAAIRDALGDAQGATSQPFLTLANKSFVLAIDMLSEALLTNPLDQSAAQIAEFIVAAQTYALAFQPPAKPAWLTTITTDEQFLSTLIKEVKTSAPSQVNALGVFDSIGNALSATGAKIKQAVTGAKTKVFDTVGDFASTKVLAWSRESLNETIGRFFGDVFIYMHGRGDKANPGVIPQRILQAWDQAIAQAPGEPLVIIGHSLGGVISYDLLSHFRPNLNVDLFISIGSQVSHFEEIKLFKTSDTSIPNGDMTKRVPKPANIRHWINVFDEVDIFSYACDKVFSGVHDFHYDTKTYVLKAHSAYFAQARFYERLRARINQLQP